MKGYRADKFYLDEACWVPSDKKRELYDAFYAGWLAGLDESTGTINLFNDWYDAYFKESND